MDAIKRFLATFVSGGYICCHSSYVTNVFWTLSMAAGIIEMMDIDKQEI